MQTSSPQLIDALAAYIPIDRRLAIARGEELPDWCWGTAVLADISGSTPLTEALVKELGPKRGADELTRYLDMVYGALIAEIERYRGTVIGFAGDAITCWFNEDEGLRAVAAGLAMQQAMAQFADLRTPEGRFAVPLYIKVAIASGPARRFRVGDPNIQLIDTLAGATLDRMALAEQHAEKGEVVVTSEIASHLAGSIEVGEFRPILEERSPSQNPPTTDHRNPKSKIQNPGVVPVARLLGHVEEDPWPPLPAGELSEEQVRPWVLPGVYERLRAGQGRFLLEIRPAVPLFLRFGGIDYDGDPAAGDKLDAFVQWVQGVVTRHGGSTIELVIGDKGSGLYSIFGAPVAHDDAPLRAVAASMELRSVPSELDYVKSVKLGISWGRMRAGPYGGPTRQSYGVLGDQVNLAARLVSKAQPGEVLISRRVAQAVSRQYELCDLGPVSVKGKQEQVQVSLVLGHKGEAALQDAGRYANPLVGRDKELAQVERALDASLSGRGQVLRIEGPAGIGKSHLSAELIRRAEQHGMQVALGACQSTGQDTVYASWRQVVRSLLDLPEMAAGEDASADGARELGEVESRVAQRNPDWLLRLPLLGDLLGLPFPDNATTSAFDPKLRQAALFDLVGDMVQSWAQEQPLLLLIDDVHWMDATSQDLALAVCRRIAQHPVLVGLVSRPPLPDQQIVPGLERLAWYQQLSLDDLPIEGVAALVANRLGGPVSPLAVSLIQTATQGNPFFVEEVVDSLRESGGLQMGTEFRVPSSELTERDTQRVAENAERETYHPSPITHHPPPQEWVLSQTLIDALREAGCLQWEVGKWAIAPNASLATLDLGLPDSVEGAVLSRLDRLPEQHKLTMKVASVIGHIFALDLLARVHPLQMTEEELAEQIGVLEARDFAHLESPPPRPLYIFKHNITHDVAYGTLLFEQRTQLHRAVGEALESLAPDELGQLAYHTFAGEDWDRALRYQSLAGERAQKIFANHGAIEHFRKALVCAGKLPTERTIQQRQQIHIGLGELLTTTGQYDAALEHLREGLASSQALEDRDTQARACRWMARVYENLGDFPSALEWIQKGLDALGDNESELASPAAAELLAIAGLIHSRQGDSEAALEKGQSSVRMAERLGEQKVMAFGHNLLGHVTRLRGNRAEAIEHFQNALELYRQVDNASGQAISHNQIATVYFHLSRWPDADLHYRMARDIFNRIGDTYNLIFANNNLGGIALNQGRLQEALELYLEALHSLEQIGGSPYVIGVLHMNLGATYVRRGELEAAREHLQKSRDYFDRAQARDFLPEMHRHMAEAEILAERWDEAKREAEQALTLARELGMRGEEGSSLRVLGEAISILDFRFRILDFEPDLESKSETLKSTEQHLTESLSILQEVGDEYEAARTELSLATLYIAQGKLQEGMAALERSTATFERLGAAGDLAKAASLRSGSEFRVPSSELS